MQSRLAQAVAAARKMKRIGRDGAAREIWFAVYEDLSEGKPGLAGSLLGRSEAHVMRFAMLYALLDQSAVIRADHILAALACWKYVEQSVFHVFGNSLGDPIADELLAALKGCPAGLTRTAIRDLFGRNQASDRIGRALGLLLKHRLVRRIEEGEGVRRTERWFAA
jgi:hypothetical protein